MLANTGNFRFDLLGPILNEGFGTEVFVADRILPALPVSKVNGAIPSFLFTDNQAYNIAHSPKTPYQRIVSKIGTKTFSCVEAGLEEALTPEDFDAIPRAQAEVLIAQKLTKKVLQSRDITLAATLFSATGESLVGAGNVVTAANAWTSASADPVKDCLDAQEKVLKATGVYANAMVMGIGCYLNICRNSAIRTKLFPAAVAGGALGGAKPTMAMIPLEILALAFGVDEIIIGQGTVNANSDQNAATSQGFIWPSTYAMLFRKSSGAANVSEVGFGRTFIYDQANYYGELAKGIVDSQRGLVMEQYRSDNINADVFRCREFIAMTPLVPQAAALIKSI